MVLENLIKPQWVVRDPLYALYLGVTLSFIGTSIGLFVFPGDASLAGLLFTTIAAVPFLQKVLDFVEEKKGVWHRAFWTRNKSIAYTYGLFFFGVAITYFIWYLILPEQASTFFFNKQIGALSSVGKFIGLFGGSGAATYSAIVLSNLKVLLIVLALSLIYGAGAALIIIWNASILGVFAASFGKFTSFFAFIPHTTFEFVGFFFAAMAGGLVSLAFVPEKTKYASSKFNRALMDAGMLAVLSVFFVLIAAALEVGVV